MGGTSRIASATSASSDGLGRRDPELPLEQQVELGEAERAQQQWLVGAANQATAARWLRSATSAAATIADGSSRIAT